MTNRRLQILERIARAVRELPFGCSQALPWCRESFPSVDRSIKELDALEQQEPHAQTVYVVMQGTDESGKVVSVHLTIEGAEQFIESDDCTWLPWYLFIEELPL